MGRASAPTSIQSITQHSEIANCQLPTDLSQHSALKKAHRLTTLKNCDQIVELGDDRIKQIGIYVEIVSKDQDNGRTFPLNPQNSSFTK